MTFQSLVCKYTRQLLIWVQSNITTEKNWMTSLQISVFSQN